MSTDNFSPVVKIAETMGYETANDPSVRVRLGNYIASWADEHKVYSRLRSGGHPTHSHRLYEDTPELRSVIDEFFVDQIKPRLSVSTYPTVRFYPKSASVEIHAQRVWNILTARALAHQTITYGEIAKMLKFNGASIMGDILEPIMQFCRLNQLPPLTVLVVGKRSGKPGSGLRFYLEDFDKARQEVFNYDWTSVIDPLAEDLRQAKMDGSKLR